MQGQGFDEAPPARVKRPEPWACAAYLHAQIMRPQTVRSNKNFLARFVREVAADSVSTSASWPGVKTWQN